MAFNDVDQFAITWKVPRPYAQGELHLCAAEPGQQPCTATFVFTDPGLKAQIDNYGPNLYHDLARPDGIALTFTRPPGSFNLTVSNLVNADASTVTVRVECWNPQGNDIAHRFDVVQGGTQTRRVIYR
jgi:hypothetical protein